MPNNLEECTRTTSPAQQSARRFEIVDACVIETPGNRQGSISLWYPIIPDTPYQRVLDLAIVDAPAG